MDYPAQESEVIRSAFEPGGILEHDHITTIIDEQHPELHPLRNIQRVLCGEHGTFDTVRAAILVEESYTKHMQEKLDKGVSVKEVTRTEGLFALKEAEHYVQFEPSMPHNDELYKILHACLEAGRTDPDKDALEVLDCYVNGYPDEVEHQDI